MPWVCFQGKYRNETKKSNETKDTEIDIYELMVLGLKVGIKMDDYNNMDYPLLVNLIDASLPKKEEKPKYRMATQEDIDMIT